MSLVILYPTKKFIVFICVWTTLHHMFIVTASTRSCHFFGLFLVTWQFCIVSRSALSFILHYCSTCRPVSSWYIEICVHLLLQYKNVSFTYIFMFMLYQEHSPGPVEGQHLLLNANSPSLCPLFFCLLSFISPCIIVFCSEDESNACLQNINKFLADYLALCSKSTVGWVCWWWTLNTIVCFSQSFWYMYKIYFWCNIFIMKKTFFRIGMCRHVWLLMQEPKNICSLCPQKS